MSVRVRVCFKCKEYTIIYTLNHTCLGKLKKFDSEHKGHPVQTVNRSELDKSYILWIPKDPPACIIKKEFW